MEASGSYGHISFLIYYYYFFFFGGGVELGEGNKMAYINNVSDNYIFKF